MNNSGLQLSFSNSEALLKPLVEEIGSKLDSEGTKSISEVDIDVATQNPVILDYTKNM